MAEEIGPGRRFGVVAREKCGLIRLAAAADSAEGLERCRAMVRFAFDADSVVYVPTNVKTGFQRPA